MRPMTAEERTTWIAESQDDYVARRAKAGEPEEVARRTVEEQHASYFPDGRPAPGHELMVFEDGGARVGRVWVGPHPMHPDAPEAAWVYNIEIDEPFRGRGFGRAGLAAVEAHLSRAGVVEVGLNVFGDNHAARQLYTTSGYDEYAITMEKKLR